MSTPSTTMVNPPVHEFDDDAPEDGVPDVRRRSLTRLSVTLAAAVLVGVGVLAGIVAQKHYGGSSSSSGQAVGLSAPGGAAGGFGGGAAAGGGSTSGGAVGGFAGATVGQVATIKGSTLYVTDQSGNTVKVKTTAATPVTKSVTTKVTAVYPGDNVTVLGTKDATGSVRATSITLGTAGQAAGAVAAGAGGGSRPAGSARGAATTGAPTTAKKAGSTKSKSSGSTRAAPAVSAKFTSCLAQHGIKLSGAAGASTLSSAKGQAAMKACQRFAPKGAPAAPNG